jgi:hypothetical protein
MAEFDHLAFMSHALLWAENTEEQPPENLETEDENGLSRIELAEASILAHPPENHAQMIVQIEIICQDLGGGVRYDGLDLKALRNIQRALLNPRLAGDGDFGRFAAIRSASGNEAEGTGYGGSPLLSH